MDVATLLRTTREQAQLSQRELARRAGTSPAAVCMYEQGTRIPRTDTLARLIAATGAQLTYGIHHAPDLDMAENGRILEELLDLADHLPQRHSPTLDMPPLRSLVESPLVKG